MSVFAVTRETIASVAPIPNADRIEVATLEGLDFTFVIRKGQFEPGDAVLYFPVDSLLPVDVSEQLGLKGKLAGPDMDRVKTMRMRKVISQGVVAPADMVPRDMLDPTEITTFIGVTKYDPPLNEVTDAILGRLPTGQSEYDIESADRYTDLAASLMDELVFVSEKLEGQNFWVRSEPGEAEIVGMRTCAIYPKGGETNMLLEMAHRPGINLPNMALTLSKQHGQPVTIYGEAIGPGILGNYYGLDKVTVRLFDIKVGFDWMTPQEFLEAVGHWKSEQWVVPILAHPKDRMTLREWLKGRTIKEASDGYSMLCKRRREGIVIKPLTESRDMTIGRMLLKQRSPRYLSKSDL